MAALRPFLYAADRMFATRVVHTVLRGVSQDRFDLLGEEYFQYKLKPQLKAEGVRRLKLLASRARKWCWSARDWIMSCARWRNILA